MIFRPLALRVEVCLKGSFRVQSGGLESVFNELIDNEENILIFINGFVYKPRTLLRLPRDVDDLSLRAAMMNL